MPRAVPVWLCRDLPRAVIYFCIAIVLFGADRNPKHLLRKHALCIVVRGGVTHGVKYNSHQQGLY